MLQDSLSLLAFYLILHIPITTINPERLVCHDAPCHPPVLRSCTPPPLASLLSRRLNVSLWNVWGFLTPLILFAVFIGCLFSLHFVPWPC